MGAGRRLMTLALLSFPAPGQRAEKVDGSVVVLENPAPRYVFMGDVCCSMRAPFALVYSRYWRPSAASLF